MIAFVKANFWTIVVCAILIIAVIIVIKKLINDKKNGKACCGDCSQCGSACPYSKKGE